MNKIIILLIASFSIATNSYAQNISKSDWITYVQKALPGVICQSDQYFRQCFNVSDNNCLQVARKASLDCLSNEAPNIPKILDFIVGEQWGNIIETCVGGEYEERFSDKKSKAPQCSNSSYWIK